MCVCVCVCFCVCLCAFVRPCMLISFHLISISLYSLSLSLYIYIYIYIYISFSHIHIHTHTRSWAFATYTHVWLFTEIFEHFANKSKKQRCDRTFFKKTYRFYNRRKPRFIEFLQHFDLLQIVRFPKILRVCVFLLTSPDAYQWSSVSKINKDFLRVTVPFNWCDFAP